MKFVIIGLSITSSWGNGHATTYRSLLKGLASLGHDILFLEKDVSYYANNRDMPDPAFCKVKLYQTLEELKETFVHEITNADVVIVGSYVDQGVDVGKWAIKTANGVTAFYDIDTPVTMAKLERRDYEYLHPDLIKKYDLYLSFSGGSVLNFIEEHYGSPNAKALYCSVDTDLYYPEDTDTKWQMGYLGTYSTDRQPTVEELLNRPAFLCEDKKFVVAGPQYPQDYNWSENVQRIDHLPPAEHRAFYNAQKYTLNVTRHDMIRAGHSPSVRLFEAAACGVPIISDYWEGIDSIFKIGSEILIARSASDVELFFKNIPEEDRRVLGENARKKVLKYHTGKARAQQLEALVKQQHIPSEKVNI